MPKPVLLSVVIPVYNEEANVASLAQEVTAALDGAGLAWEAVWVDDGSRDGTRAALRALPAPHRWIALDRNQGQSAALLAGLRQARGEWLGTLDGDAQNDPADLPRQLAQAQAQGVDMVNGIRAKRNDSLIRRISSRIGNGVRNWLTGERVTDVGCSTRVLRATIVPELPFFHGMHRFLPTLVRLRGFTIAEIPVNHRPRAAGISKYGVLNRLFKGLRDIFGVRWLASRARVWKIVESGAQPDEPNRA